MASSRRKLGNPDLLAVGLEDAAGWQIDGKKLKHVGDNKANWQRLTSIPNCLYAFCCGDDVLYIGKTTKTLSKRFVGYCDPGNGRATNWKCHQGIRRLLERGREVRIFVLPSHSHLRWSGYEINMAAGLEDSLLRAFQPPWNGSNKRWLSEAAANEEELSHSGKP
jgi:hypothetical protein